ncbi:uncharacterized protein LOC100826456 isoform X2 [Brachypodium distachyon]|uniref:uncharacterized protein LOC100826456 isoform X2 n=1 Tax=Brachypodium distachyon TaxID=15368 RepID=UPI000D0DDA24|nr:uncharacterized protein LOC100826456 isoform X2 [Brachypodium distachyon]|eukprot:XP_024317859.1 uncharacterized protein LOC100826456 isoform X2 [Brachypodium distachyon]
MADVNAPDLPPTSEIVRRRTPPLPLSHCHLLPPCHAPPPATEPLHARVCIDLSLPPRMCPRMRTGSHGFSTLCWPLLHHHNHSSPQPLPVTLQPKESLQGKDEPLDLGHHRDPTTVLS